MLLTLLALAAPVSAFAIDDGALKPVTATPGPAAIHVSTALDSCGLLDDGVVCKIDVSFNAIPNADSYSATVTRADGSVIDYGSVSAGGTSLWVPYVGSGSYSVRITAYGAPDSPKDRDGRGDVIATGVTRSDDRDKPKRKDSRDGPRAGGAAVETQATGRNPGASANTGADGQPSTGVTSSAAAQQACAAPPEPAAPAPTPPEEPPEDLDPENPDEDADGIPDEIELETYEQQLAEYEAAVAAHQQAQAPPAGC